MVLHIFNPSHDEALGFGSPYYVPTKAAMLLARERCTLPELWAKPGDAILLTDDRERPVANDTEKPFLYVYKRELTPKFIHKITRIEPWGWNAYLRHTLRRLGIPDTLLPTDEELDHRRRLSSRETATTLLHRLTAEDETLAGRATWCTTIEDAWQAVRTYGRAMAKSPWSSSGRGVFRVEAEDNVIPADARMRNIIKQYGGIAIEEYCERIQDFALEFYAQQDGTITYAGLSVFNTSVGGNYLGNIEGTQAELQALINRLIPWNHVKACIQRLIVHLQALIEGHYVGPLGVDLMVVKQENALKLHPCVEINLRNTMGHVALLLNEIIASSI